MTVDTRLNASKEYVWFLANIETRNIKGSPTIVFDWTCKTAGVTIKEFLRIQKQFDGSRLCSMMESLGWDKKKDANITPQIFFEKGFHMKAKPIRYYSELNSEVMKWKLNYESLSPIGDKAPTISDEDMKTLHRLCATKGTPGEVIAHLATHRMELVEPFIQYSKTGQFKFGRQT